jgi:biopolymer transport protein ExbD
MAINLNQDDEEQIMAEINMTPLIDVMLVLLIIFMVTSSISLESGLDIDLPDTASKTAKKQDKAVIISLDEKGNIFIQGKAVERELLGRAISESLKKEGTTLVIYEGDKRSQLGNAVEIMDIAKQAGAEKFAIAAEGSGE